MVVLEEDDDMMNDNTRMAELPLLCLVDGGSLESEEEQKAMTMTCWREKKRGKQERHARATKTPADIDRPSSVLDEEHAQA